MKQSTRDNLYWFVMGMCAASILLTTIENRSRDRKVWTASTSPIVKSLTNGFLLVDPNTEPVVGVAGDRRGAVFTVLPVERLITNRAGKPCNNTYG